MNGDRLKLMKSASFFILQLSLAVLLSGCFKEPRSAEDSVPAGTHVYLKDQGLEVLTPGQVLQGGALKPEAITYLNLDYNALTDVEAVVAFKGLKWLRLNNNKLERLPADLSALNSLRRLYLRDNAFTVVPPALAKGLPELETLDLSGNPIGEIPDWLAARKGLRHLNLSDTHVKRLPADLSAWRSLVSLQMGGLNGLTLEEMTRIRAALPDTRIVF